MFRSSPGKWLKFLHKHPLKHLEFIEYGLGYQVGISKFNYPNVYILCVITELHYRV